VDSVGTTYGNYTGTTSTTGILGKAISIADVADRISIPQGYSTTSFSTKMTLGVWWKPLFPNSNGQTLISHSNDYRVYYDSGAFKLTLMGSSGQSTFSAPVAPDGGTLQGGTWYHVVWVYDATASSPNLKAFVNGVKTTFDFTDGPIQTVLGSMLIGYGNGSATYGAFDDAFVAKTPFTDAQVLELWNNGAGKAVGDCSTCQPGAYWKLDDRPLNNVADSVGSSNGTVHAYVVPALGQVGEAAAFTGKSGQYIDIPFDGTQEYPQFSVACWFRANKYMVAGNTRQAMVSNGSASSGFALGFGYPVNDTVDGGSSQKVDGPSFTVDGQSVFDSSVNFQAGAWHHLVGTFDGSKLRLYLDGSLLGEADGPATPLTTWTNGISIGRLNNTWYPPDGDIDDVVMYDAALSAPEVNTLYLRGKAGQPAYP